ncbi:MAG: HAD-IB family phosphatase [Candidatus Methanomethylophilaceae archaeon]|jgi:phosphoserine phosphatase
MDYELVCFDMDGTLTTQRSSWGWVHDVYEVDNGESYYAFCSGEIDEPEFMRRDIALWKNADPDVTIDKISRIFRTMPLTEGIQETVAALKSEGMRCVIVSGGIDIAAKMIADEFGFDSYIADSLETCEGGRLTGEGIMNVDLRDKGINVREFQKKYGTDKDRTVSIGNSFTDIGMFGNSGLSIAFNPIDEMTVEAADAVVRSDNISDVLDIIFG